MKQLTLALIVLTGLILPLTAGRCADIGVDTAVVTSATAMLMSPDGDSDRIGVLPAGATVVLISRSAVAGFLDVIVYETGHEGWIPAKRLKIRYTAHRRPEIALNGTPDGTDAPPAIDVDNESDEMMYLHVAGSQEVLVDSHSSRDVVVTPGVHSFNGSAARALPAFGHVACAAGVTYHWVWTIGDSSGHAAHADPALVARFNQMQADVKTKSIDLANLKAVIAAEEVDVNSRKAQLEQDRSAVDAAKGAVDQADQASIDAYNEKIDDYNAEHDAGEQALAKYNADVDSYDAKVQDLNAERKRLADLGDRINNPAP